MIGIYVLSLVTIFYTSKWCTYYVAKAFENPKKTSKAMYIVLLISFLVNCYFYHFTILNVISIIIKIRGIEKGIDKYVDKKE